MDNPGSLELLLTVLPGPISSRCIDGLFCFVHFFFIARGHTEEVGSVPMGPGCAALSSPPFPVLRGLGRACTHAQCVFQAQGLRFEPSVGHVECSTFTHQPTGLARILGSSLLKLNYLKTASVGAGTERAP